LGAGSRLSAQSMSHLRSKCDVILM
jgi:hypothetical protein